MDDHKRGRERDGAKSDAAVVIKAAEVDCPNCGNEVGHEVIGCNWWRCDECRCEWDEDRRDDDSRSEVCKTYEQAHEHFGASQYHDPTCTIDAVTCQLVKERHEADDNARHHGEVAQAAVLEADSLRVSNASLVEALRRIANGEVMDGAWRQIDTVHAYQRLASKTLAAQNVTHSTMTTATLDRLDGQTETKADAALAAAEGAKP